MSSNDSSQLRLDVYEDELLKEIEDVHMVHTWLMCQKDQHVIIREHDVIVEEGNPSNLN